MKLPRTLSERKHRDQRFVLITIIELIVVPLETGPKDLDIFIAIGSHARGRRPWRVHVMFYIMPRHLAQPPSSHPLLMVA